MKAPDGMEKFINDLISEMNVVLMDAAIDIAEVAPTREIALLMLMKLRDCKAAVIFIPREEEKLH
jgi:hypothetical protein